MVTILGLIGNSRTPFVCNLLFRYTFFPRWSFSASRHTLPVVVYVILHIPDLISKGDLSSILQAFPTKQNLTFEWPEQLMRS